MILGMTGFSTYHYLDEEWEIQLEIKGYNSKGFDLNVRLNSEFSFLEIPLRKYLGKYLKRGKVYFYLKIINLKEKEYRLIINENLLKMVKEARQLISDSFKDKVDFSFRDALSVPDLLKFLPNKEQDEEKVWNNLKKHLDELLSKFLLFQKREGEEAVIDLRRMIIDMKKAVEEIEKFYQQERPRLKDKIQELLDYLRDDKRVNEERLEQELAVQMSRLDITEEIVRLKTHLKELEGILNYKKIDDKSILQEASIYVPIGLKLDFLSQEVLREANTINSKSEKIEIIKNALFIKEEITKLREQARNIK